VSAALAHAPSDPGSRHLRCLTQCPAALVRDVARTV
jgi:hypothetical protein